MRLFVLPHASTSTLSPRAEGVIFHDGTIALRPPTGRKRYLYDDLTALEEDWGRATLDFDHFTDMQCFHLVRDVNVSGSPGIVAEGVMWSNGGAVMRWLHEPCTTQVYRHIDEVLRIHGQGGSTRLVVFGRLP